MYLRDLELENFRNFRQLSVSFAPGLNIIHGENGAGKTNLLEAIYYLTIARSHRSRKDDDLVRFNTDFFKIRATAVRGDSVSKYEVTYSTERIPNKKVVINVSVVERISSMIGEFRSVTLSFDDVNLVRGSPYYRRRFLDILLSEVSSSYLADAISYRRVLQQRNRQLWEMRTNSKGNSHLLESWDSQLVELGSRIISKRLEVSKTLSDLVKELSDSMGIRSKLELRYLPSFPLEEEVDAGFRHYLARERERELMRAQTLVGPHRDDIGISLNGINLRRFGSCGQQRLVAVVMRFAEASLLDNLYRDPPILMLDEILVELDLPTRERVMNHLKKYSQIFVASASPLRLENSGVRYYTLKDGVLEWKE
jgi:DNA replication and repair protein RecF